MLAIKALSGKFADPMTIGPPAAAEPEPAADPDAAALAGAELELASGSEEDPHADSARAAARPTATTALPRVNRDRTDTGTPCRVGTRTGRDVTGWGDWWVGSMGQGPAASWPAEPRVVGCNIGSDAVGRSSTPRPSYAGAKHDHVGSGGPGPHLSAGQAGGDHVMTDDRQDSITDDRQQADQESTGNHHRIVLLGQAVDDIPTEPTE